MALRLILRFVVWTPKVATSLRNECQWWAMRISGLWQHTRPSRRHTEGSRELKVAVSDASSER